MDQKTENTLQRTSLFQHHIASGARMVPFAGFEMPVQYSGIVEEHLAVREAAGLFDVSHMGEFIVSGPTAHETVQRLVTNDAGRLYDGRAMYAVMCSQNGGIVDDLLVYRLATDRFMLVVNAANRAKDIDWIYDHLLPDASFQDASDDIALIALQGPSSFSILGRVARDLQLDELRYYHFLVAPKGRFFGCENPIISRTGYTGETGVEIYCEPDRAADVWSGLLEAGRDLGIKPAGLGARDTLRLEAGFPLYGNDLDESTNPIEAGLDWIVRFEKPDFIGREALIRIREDGPERRLIGFVMEERGIPRKGYPIQADGRGVGSVTSGTQSPVLNKGIGMGYVENHPHFVEPGASISISIRDRVTAARTVRPPFHKK